MIIVRKYKFEAVRKYKNEAIGWVGAVFSLTGFSLNSLNLVSSQSLQYLSLNVLGCLLMIIYAVHKKAHANWVLNSIWILMTLVAFAKAYLIV